MHRDEINIESGQICHQSARVWRRNLQATGRNFEQLYSVIDGLNSAAMDPVNMCYNLGKGMELERGGGGETLSNFLAYFRGNGLPTQRTSFSRAPILARQGGRKQNNLLAGSLSPCLSIYLLTGGLSK